MSLRFQADADLRLNILKAVRQREPSIDFASAIESGLTGVSDPEVLERAAQAGRILVSHDRHTMLDHFRGRLIAGKSSPGLFILPQRAPIGLAVEALVLAWSASDPAEWFNQVHHLPALAPHVFAR